MRFSTSVSKINKCLPYKCRLHLALTPFFSNDRRCWTFAKDHPSSIVDSIMSSALNSPADTEIDHQPRYNPGRGYIWTDILQTVYRCLQAPFIWARVMKGVIFELIPDNNRREALVFNLVWIFTLLLKVIREQLEVYMVNCAVRDSTSDE